MEKITESGVERLLKQNDVFPEFSQKDMLVASAILTSRAAIRGVMNTHEACGLSDLQSKITVDVQGRALAAVYAPCAGEIRVGTSREDSR